MSALARLIRFCAAFAICAPALFMPHRVRTIYQALIARAAHAPFILFGLIARKLFRELGLENPYRDEQYER